jgi:hypothetical protein
MAAMADDAPDGATEAAQPTLTDDDQAALQHWARVTGLGSRVTCVEPHRR